MIVTAVAMAFSVMSVVYFEKRESKKVVTLEATTNDIESDGEVSVIHGKPTKTEVSV